MNNRKCAFTIVARNYIGLANILKTSVERHATDVDFYVFLVDELEVPNEEFIRVARKTLDISSEQWMEMSFKYSLTEFCTAIKPSCFKYLLLNLDYSSAIYFDPDIYLFSPISDIYSLLNHYSVVVTPQSVGIHFHYTGEHPESDVMLNGIFNLGFCAIAKTKKALLILNWWEERLNDKCFTDKTKGYFTDQKWMDWLPALLDNKTLYVAQNLGMNMAPWNYFEREVLKKEGEYYVKFRDNSLEEIEYRLMFVHFAGYDYKGIANGKINRKRISNLRVYSDIDPLIAEYQKAIETQREDFNKYINLGYGYGEYTNGMKIERFHRRLFHGLLENGTSFSDPFSTGKDSFYQLIIKNKVYDKKNSVDSWNKSTLPDFNKRKKQLNLFFRFLFLILGYKRYVLFVKALSFYSRPEQHAFLLKK